MRRLAGENLALIGSSIRGKPSILEGRRDEEEGGFKPRGEGRREADDSMRGGVDSPRGRGTEGAVIVRWNQELFPCIAGR